MNIKDTLSEKVSQVLEKGKETISSGVQGYKEGIEKRENIQAEKVGFAEGQRRKLNQLKEEAKLKALLEFKAKKEIEQQYQQLAPRIKLPQRKLINIFSFTNRPFMETDPFIGDNPFFPKRRRPL